jgi:hypothetical protein
MELYPGWSARDNYGYGAKKKKRKKERVTITDSGGRPPIPNLNLFISTKSFTQFYLSLKFITGKRIVNWVH